MYLEDRLIQDLKIYIKNGDNIKKNTVQQIRAQILLAKKVKQSELTEKEIEDVIVKEKNNRLESLVQFEKAQRQDLVEQTKKEILCINYYLPQPFSDIELVENVQMVIDEENVSDLKFMSYIIKKCKEKFGNRTSGKQLSEVVRQLLNAKND